MATVRKKVLLEYFEKLLNGTKKFEFRLADFDIKEGDTLILEEWNGMGVDRKPTGRTLEKTVSYMIHLDLDAFGQKEAIEEHGFYIIQFEE